MPPHPAPFWEPLFAKPRKPFLDHSERTGFPQIVLLLPLQDPQGALKKTLGCGPACLACVRPVLLSFGVRRPLVIWGPAGGQVCQGTTSHQTQV